MTLDGLHWLYPYHQEGQEAKRYIDFLLRGDRELKKSYESLSLSRASNSIGSLIASLRGERSFKLRFYHVIENIRIAQAKNPIQGMEERDILLSMK